MRNLWFALVCALGWACLAASAYAASPVVNSTVAIVDPYTPAQQATVTTGGALLIQPVSGTANGCTPYHLAGGTAASTNSTSIKGSAGNLCHLTAINTTVTTYYLRIYDSAAAPTCSSATGAKHTYPILASGGINIPLPLGESYASGIGFCVTGGGADTDNTNAATGVYIEASYK